MADQNEIRAAFREGASDRATEIAGRAGDDDSSRVHDE
jgi:hypothetical protein